MFRKVILLMSYFNKTTEYLFGKCVASNNTFYFYSVNYIIQNDSLIMLTSIFPLNLFLKCLSKLVKHIFIFRDFS